MAAFAGVFGFALEPTKVSFFFVAKILSLGQLFMLSHFFFAFDDSRSFQNSFFE
jgi:hypothetical protein